MKENYLNTSRYFLKKKNVINDEFFKYLYLKYPELKYKYDKKQIREIITSFNIALREEVVFNRDGVDIPLLGKTLVTNAYLPINKNRSNAYIDYGKFTKSGCKEKVLFNNNETNGYVAKIKMNNTTKSSKSFPLKFYFFKPCRLLSRQVSAEFRKNYKRYKIISNGKIQVTKRNLSIKSLKYHNEFAI